MSEGCLLRAIVRGLMSDEFLQSSEFADALRPVYEGSPGKDAASAIARRVYDALSTQDAKDALRDRLLRHGHLRKRFTPDGISVADAVAAAVTDALARGARRSVGVERGAAHAEAAPSRPHSVRSEPRRTRHRCMPQRVRSIAWQRLLPERARVGGRDA